MKCSYPTEICCARQIEFDVDESGVVSNIVFFGGDGWTLDQIIGKCSGNLCRNKGTSCADQFARVCARAKADLGL